MPRRPRARPPARARTPWLVVAAGGTIETALLPYRLLHLRADYGVRVSAALSARALDFVTRISIAALSGEPAYVDNDQTHPASGLPLHLSLSEADLLLVHPASARILAQAAAGDVTCAVTRLIAFTPKDRIVFAPAIHPRMDRRLYERHASALAVLGCTILGRELLSTDWSEIEHAITLRLSLTRSRQRPGTILLEKLLGGRH